jgi:hypothetical protein
MAWDRLNLPEIDAALADLGAAPRAQIDADETGEPLVGDALRRLGEGYRYVDSLLGDRLEIFRYGQTGHILEINHRVLCGTTPERRVQYADHIAETDRWFYDRPGAGIAALFSWLQRHRTQPPLSLAAGIFVQVLSHPQLFIEGNARSATLLASYVLARAGLPPLVVTSEDFPRYRDLTDRCLALDRTGLTGAFSASVATSRAAAFLQSAVDRRFLRTEEAPVTCVRPAAPESR